MDASPSILSAGRSTPFSTFRNFADRVRVRPKSHADLMDRAVAGRIALIVEDDLGYLKQTGCRFFSTIHELEPLPEGE